MYFNFIILLLYYEYLHVSNAFYNILYYIILFIHFKNKNLLHFHQAKKFYKIKPKNYTCFNNAITIKEFELLVLSYNAFKIFKHFSKFRVKPFHFL